jgi:hypothetical protein
VLFFILRRPKKCFASKKFQSLFSAIFHLTNFEAKVSPPKNSTHPDFFGKDLPLFLTKKNKKLKNFLLTF